MVDGGLSVIQEKKNFYADTKAVHVFSPSKMAFHKDKLVNIKEVFDGKSDTPMAPINMWVKPTNICDHACSYCSYCFGTDTPVVETIQHGDQLKREVMLGFIDDCGEMGVKSLTYTGGGESLVYPHITECFEKTLDLGIELSAITNGQTMEGKKAELLGKAAWVRVSLSETDPIRFKKERFRNKDTFNQLINNIKNFVKTKNSECKFGINYVINRGCADHIYNDVRFFKSLGVDYVKFTPAYGIRDETELFEIKIPGSTKVRFRENKKLMEVRREEGTGKYTFQDYMDYHGPYKDKYLEQINMAREDFQDNAVEGFKVQSTIETDFSSTSTDERPVTRCPIIQIVPTLGADGGIYPCHDKTYMEGAQLGNINDMRFKDIWKSPKVLNIMRNLNPKVSCRHHCSYDQRNLLAEDMMANINKIDSFKPESNLHANFP